jgi:hypothetical protein
MFITADQLLAHAVGDYILQSHWMANEKQQRNLAAWAHGFMYGLPFLFFRPHWHTFAFIVVTHWFIDHFKLARYVVYAKNFISPRWTSEEMEVPPEGLPLPGGETVAGGFQYKKREWWHPWGECSLTGYHQDVPMWLATWLYIIADNIMHVLCNGFAFWLQANVPF